MKALYVLLVILLLSQYKAEKCDSDTLPTQPIDCHNREKSSQNEHKCCYVYQKYFLIGTLRREKLCNPVTKNEFDNIENVINSLKGGIEKLGGIIDTIDVNCSSNYLYISLLSLMIFLL